MIVSGLVETLVKPYSGGAAPMRFQGRRQDQSPLCDNASAYARKTFSSYATPLPAERRSFAKGAIVRFDVLDRHRSCSALSVRHAACTVAGAFRTSDLENEFGRRAQQDDMKPSEYARSWGLFAEPARSF